MKPSHILRYFGGWMLGSLLCICSHAFAQPNQESDASDLAAQDRVVHLKQFVVSATRIEKNPWRYASIPGFEVLSRANDRDTNWWLVALQRGLLIENEVIPAEWITSSPIPYTVIIDDMDFKADKAGLIHLQPAEFRRPSDSLTWGDLSERTEIWNDRVEARDDDTFAININIHDVNTRAMVTGSISLERLYRSAPALPSWVLAGLLNQDYGLFRQSFVPISTPGQDGLIRKVEGPGILWVSLDETQALLKQIRKNKKIKIPIPPLGTLFSDALPSEETLPLWLSEAALFVRWGLLGPGHADPVLSRAFLEFIQRARRGPVTEAVFVECFGFGYAAMEEKLATFLRTVLAQPTSIRIDFPQIFPEPALKAATADQIGRILGDWLRMQGKNLQTKNPSMRVECLSASRRVLERAYQDDTGLPPDVNPASRGGRVAQPDQNSDKDRTVIMKPFMVSTARIHDPSLLAVYGLYEHDAGFDDKARVFLEEAIKTGARRPNASLVLAGLRQEEAIAKPAGKNGKLSAQQTTEILAPLQSELRSTTQPEARRLIVETWLLSEAKPDEQEIDRLIQGVSLHPRDISLAYRSALVCAKNDYPVQANDLITRGLVFASNTADRNSLEGLRETLASQGTGSKD